MKKKSIIRVLSLLFLGAVCVSCKQDSKRISDQAPSAGAEVVMKDYGAGPAVLDIEAYTMANKNFRTALWTGSKLQVTLMSIPVGGEVGLELHPDTDQFLRIEEGEAKVLMGDSKEDLSFTQTVVSDFAIFVPAGKWHNLINTGTRPLKLYSIYSPVEHPHGTVHQTQQEGGHH